jgi:hypothetical protein
LSTFVLGVFGVFGVFLQFLGFGGFHGNFFLDSYRAIRKQEYFNKYQATSSN